MRIALSGYFKLYSRRTCFIEETTEKESKYLEMDKVSVMELLTYINNEDKTVPQAVELAMPSIEKLVNLVFERMEAGGRLFLIGAGTSGRIGIIDASECPPIFGVPHLDCRVNRWRR